MYFEEDRRTKHLGQSYGHDIETCWLIDRTCDILNIEDPYIRRMTRDVAEYVYQRAMTSRGLLSEVIHGEQIEDRIWWIQAEAMVGFMNHYQKTNDEKYLKAVQDIYQFILNELVDHREGSEWFWGIDDKGNTLNDHGIAEAWKAPYHNGRALVELIKRGYEK
jgi:mannobiose 2-epimerase